MHPDSSAGWTFQWDEAKNLTNIRKHGFRLADAVEMFKGALMIRPDLAEDYGERRWIGIGVSQGRIALVAFVERDPDVIRIISLRKANREERKDYENAIQNGLEAD
jgi:uncharacterized DUF497 family protein